MDLTGKRIGKFFPRLETIFLDSFLYSFLSFYRSSNDQNIKYGSSETIGKSFISVNFFIFRERLPNERVVCRVTILRNKIEIRSVKMMSPLQRFLDACA